MHKTLVFLNILFLCTTGWANTQSCEASLKNKAGAEQKKDPQSDSILQRELIETMYRQVRKFTQGHKNPFTSDRLDSNVIGRAHQSLAEALEVYNPIYSRRLSGAKLTVKEFSDLLQTVEKEVKTLGATTPAPKLFAILEALRLLQILESNVDRPLPETTQDEAKNKKDEKDKEKDQDDKDEPEEENDFDWNKPPDEYSPENKSLQSGKSNKKQVAILKSEVITDNRLYPRKRYDVINAQGFFAAPLSRPQVNKKSDDLQRAKKSIYLLNTKKSNTIESFPVPDGYYAVVGDYQGYAVRETGPQDYTLYFTADPKTLGSELRVPVLPIESLMPNGSQGMSVYTSATGINKAQWPKKIQTLIQASKKQSSTPLEVAKKVKEHLSGADYIYFSEGSELDAAAFAVLQQKYAELLKKYPKALAMAYLESFNCDGAALIGAAILRDFFGIPTRVVGGSTAESGVLRLGNKMMEVISSGSVGHAWVEVWDAGSQRWLPFDMTPTRNSPEGSPSKGLDLESRKDQEEKNKKNKENKKSSSSQSQQSKDKSQGEDSDDSDSESGDSSQSDKKEGKGKGKGIDDQDQQGPSVGKEMKRHGASKIEADGDSVDSDGGKKDNSSESKDKVKGKRKGSKEGSEDGPGQEDDGQEGEGQGNGKGKEAKKQAGGKTSDKSDENGKSKGKGGQQMSPQGEKDEDSSPIDRKFDPRKLKSKVKNYHKLSGALLDAFYAYYLRLGLQKGLSESFIGSFDERLTEFLNSLKFVDKKNEEQAFYLKKMDYVASLSEFSKHDMIARFRSIGSQISSGKLREAWLDLQSIKVQMDELKRVTEFTPQEGEFYNELLDVLREFQQVKHVDSGSFDLADRLSKKLPGSLSRKILAEKYPQFGQIGHLDGQNLAANVLAGRETDLVRMAMAAPYTDLFLNSERIPQFGRVKTFDRSYNPNDPRDVVRTRNLSDFPRMILDIQPNKHLFADTIRGEQLAVGYTETRRIPNPKSAIDRKVSVVYYDVSGSMGSGNDSPRAVQDALIMAFVDKALSEVDTLGRPVHKVYLMPFDDAIGEPLEISTREEAIQFITLQRISYATKGHGGTEIEPVLMDFYDKVALAHETSRKNTRNPLAVLKKANLVLFSDGGSNVSYEAVKKRQEEVSAQTGVDLHLSFVAIGAENAELKQLATAIAPKGGKSTYYYIDTSMLNRILKGSDFAATDPNAFAFDERMDVSPSLVARFQKLRTLAGFGEATFDFQEFERILSGIRVEEKPSTEDTLLSDSVLDLRDAMNYVMKNTTAPWGLKQMIIETALKQYLTGIGQRATAMTEPEYRILNQLVRMRRVP